MRVLIFSLDKIHFGIVRLPKVLQQAGFKVAILCSPLNILTKTRYIDKQFFLTPAKASGKLLKQLVNAIDDWHPDMIIPGDEMAVAFLHYLVQLSTKCPNLISADVLKTLTFSLGDPKFFQATMIKSVTQQVARELNLRTPVGSSVTTETEALHFTQEHGYPVVLKQDFSWGGFGVKVCYDYTQFLSALHTFLPSKSIPLKLYLRRYLQRWLKRDWLPLNTTLSIQQFIKGRPGMYGLVAMEGEVLAGFAAISEHTTSATKPSSVVRFINHQEMTATASALISHFRYSGFAGFDFMIEEETGRAYLLECNPRPIPICYLGKMLGIDLCQALFARLSGQAYTPLPKVEQEVKIALFPQEWRRDPTSFYLQEVCHDVPWDDPLLVRAMMLQKLKYLAIESEMPAHDLLIEAANFLLDRALA